MILFKTPVFVNFIIQVVSYVLAKNRKIFIQKTTWTLTVIYQRNSSKKGSLLSTDSAFLPPKNE